MHAIKLCLLYIVALSSVPLTKTMRAKLKATHREGRFQRWRSSSNNNLERENIASKLIEEARMLLKRSEEESAGKEPSKEVKMDESWKDKGDDKADSVDRSYEDVEQNILLSKPGVTGWLCPYGSSHQCLFPGKRSEIPNDKVSRKEDLTSKTLGSLWYKL